MNLFQSVSSNVTKAVDFVVEKNRKAALINRIRIVIKNERENEARAYVALGKYYYEHLRDAQNEETEHLCRAIDFSDKRMKKAFAKLDEITAPEDGADCDEDCDYCPYYNEEDSDPEETYEAPAASTVNENKSESFDSAPASAYADVIDEEAAEDEPMHPEL